MSNSYLMAMAALLLIIGLVSISSVSGLSCYTCYDDFGPEDCKAASRVKKVCAPDEKMCYQNTYIYKKGKGDDDEDTKNYKKFGVNSRDCTAETMEKGCFDEEQYVNKVKRCFCDTDLCNGAESGHHRPLFLIAASLLAAAVVLIFPQ